MKPKPAEPGGSSRTQPYSQSHRAARLSRVIARSRDCELAKLFRGSQTAFDEISGRRFSRWVLTYSGGKDSTLTAILAVDYLRQMKRPPDLEVVYSDTLVEIPAMRQTAQVFLDHLRSLCSHVQFELRVHELKPALEERFWVRLLGRGYPPPKPKFRWCTKRLKIQPSASIVSNGEPTAVLTGVRYGESAQRTARLVASCTTGGECGQDYWASQGPTGSNITYFAPIIEWRTCKVWDFLHFVAPDAGWPTEKVFDLYGDTNLRFGCWTCTLVRRDRTVESLISRDPESSLSELHRFRERMWLGSLDARNRTWRDGHMASLTLEFRKELLAELQSLQERVRLPLIGSDEIAEINLLWAEEEASVGARIQPSIDAESADSTRLEVWM